MKVVLSFLPTAFAAFAVTPHKMFDANHMKDTFTAIAAANKEGKIDEATRTNVGRILDLIEGNLTACLAKDYEILGQEYGAAVAALKKCNSDSYTCESGPLATSQGAYDGAINRHTYCRQHESATCDWANLNKTVIDNKVRGYATAFPAWTDGTEADDHCEANAENQPVFDWTNNVLGFLGNQGRGCDSADAESCRTQGNDHHQDHDGVDHTFGCNSPATGAPGSNGTYHECCDYKTCRANFLGACKLYEDQEAQCDSIQTGTETAHCDFLNAGCSCCSAWSSCWDSEVAKMNAEVIRAQSVVNLIKSQQHALECLVCYGNQILDAGTIDFEECDNAPCEGCDAFEDMCHDAEPRFDTDDECHTELNGNNKFPDLGGIFNGATAGCYNVPHPGSICSRTCTNSAFGDAGDLAPNPTLNGFNGDKAGTTPAPVEPTTPTRDEPEIVGPVVNEPQDFASHAR